MRDFNVQFNIIYDFFKLIEKITGVSLDVSVKEKFHSG